MENLDRDLKLKFNILETFLEKIPETIPWDDESKEYMECEKNIECFLFFSISIVDILYQKINNSMVLDIQEHRVKSTTIETNLKKLKCDKAKRILEIFNEHFSNPLRWCEPVTRKYALSYSEEKLAGSLGLDFWSRFEKRDGKYYENIWDRSKSKMWEINELRNQITHRRVLTRAAQIGPNSNSMYVQIPLIQISFNKIQYDYVKNPKKYFSESYKSLRKFVDKIYKIISI